MGTGGGGGGRTSGATIPMTIVVDTGNTGSDSLWGPGDANLIYGGKALMYDRENDIMAYGRYHRETGRGIEMAIDVDVADENLVAAVWYPPNTPAWDNSFPERGPRSMPATGPMGRLDVLASRMSWHGATVPEQLTSARELLSAARGLGLRVGTPVQIYAGDDFNLREIDPIMVTL